MSGKPWNGIQLRIRDAAGLALIREGRACMVWDALWDPMRRDLRNRLPAARRTAVDGAGFK